MATLRKISPEGAQFLGRYADEVALLADGLGRLQQSLGAVYAHALAAGDIEDLQRLDTFTQTAEALARIADGFAREPMLDQGAVAAMVSSVKLADVAARLIGDRPDETHSESGDFEVF